MRCRVGELQNKQVVCMTDGAFLGYIGDVELDTATGKLTAVVLYGKPHLLGLLGRGDDLVIPFEEIAVIGTDSILVNCERLADMARLSNRDGPFTK